MKLLPEAMEFSSAMAIGIIFMIDGIRNVIHINEFGVLELILGFAVFCGGLALLKVDFEKSQIANQKRSDMDESFRRGKEKSKSRSKSESKSNFGK